MFINNLVLFKFQIINQDISLVIASTRGIWKLIMVIPVPKLTDHTFALGGSRLGASLLEDEDRQEDLGIHRFSLVSCRSICKA